MADLYIYSTPATAEVALTLDTGDTIRGVPGSANGRDDAHCLTLPEQTVNQGCTLHVDAPGFYGFTGRGILVVSDVGEFVFDDVRLTAIEVPPVPVPPNPDLDPATIIQATYDAGTFDLSTHDGCGLFTEACCLNLHQQVSPAWGHIRKTGAQNQYNGHAVDALYLLGGQGYGVYDIIHDSVAPDASPSCNWKDAGDPALWMPPV